MAVVIGSIKTNLCVVLRENYDIWPNLNRAVIANPGLRGTSGSKSYYNNDEA